MTEKEYKETIKKAYEEHLKFLRKQDEDYLKYLKQRDIESRIKEEEFNEGCHKLGLALLAILLVGVIAGLIIVQLP